MSTKSTREMIGQKTSLVPWSGSNVSCHLVKSSGSVNGFPHINRIEQKTVQMSNGSNLNLHWQRSGWRCVTCVAAEYYAAVKKNEAVPVHNVDAPRVSHWVKWDRRMKTAWKRLCVKPNVTQTELTYKTELGSQMQKTDWCCQEGGGR